jgi:hypothetical protein
LLHSRGYFGVRGQGLQAQHLDTRTRLAANHHPRGHHLGGVSHQQSPRGQQLPKLHKLPVGQLAPPPMQQPSGFALRKGVLGNAVSG